MVQVGGVEIGEEELHEFREVFDLVDKDKGGSLTTSEVKDLMELLGMQVSINDVKSMVEEIDADGSGAVDFDEFLQVMAKPQQMPYSKADLLRSFKMFAEKDAPHGCISPEALEQALLDHCGDKLSPDEVMRLIHRLDTTADGWINYVEKVNLFLMK